MSVDSSICARPKSLGPPLTTFLAGSGVGEAFLLSPTLGPREFFGEDDIECLTGAEDMLDNPVGDEMMCR